MTNDWVPLSSRYLSMVPMAFFVDVGVVGRGLEGYSWPLGTNAQSVRPAHEHGPCLRQTARLFFGVFPSVRAP